MNEEKSKSQKVEKSKSLIINKSKSTWLTWNLEHETWN